MKSVDEMIWGTANFDKIDESIAINFQSLIWRSCDRFIRSGHKIMSTMKTSFKGTNVN